MVFRELTKAIWYCRSSNSTWESVVSRIKHILVAKILSHKCNLPFLIGRWNYYQTTVYRLKDTKTTVTPTLQIKQSKLTTFLFFFKDSKTKQQNSKLRKPKLSTRKTTLNFEPWMTEWSTSKKPSLQRLVYQTDQWQGTLYSCLPSTINMSAPASPELQILLLKRIRRIRIGWISKSKHPLRSKRFRMQPTLWKLMRIRKWTVCRIEDEIFI